MKTNNYYYRLDLPNNPLSNVTIPLNPEHSVGGVVYPQSKDIINQQTIDIFASVGLEVDCCIIFLRKPAKANPERRNQNIVHRDFKFIGDQIQPWHYGVNYELHGGSSVLSWWDVNNVPLKYPTKNTNNVKLCTIMYGDMNNPFNDDYQLLESVEMSSIPTLVNTDIPHSTNYYDRRKRSLSLSIRFTNVVSSWEESVALFNRLILRN